jgi:hypothetical protein
MDMYFLTQIEDKIQKENLLEGVYVPYLEVYLISRYMKTKWSFLLVLFM